MNAANVVIRSEMEPPQIAAFMAALFFYDRNVRYFSLLY